MLFGKGIEILFSDRLNIHLILVRKAGINSHYAVFKSLESSRIKKHFFRSLADDVSTSWCFTARMFYAMRFLFSVQISSPRVYGAKLWKAKEPTGSLQVCTSTMSCVNMWESSKINKVIISRVIIISLHQLLSVIIKYSRVRSQSVYLCVYIYIFYYSTKTSGWGPGSKKTSWPRYWYHQNFSCSFLQMVQNSVMN